MKLLAANHATKYDDDFSSACYTIRRIPESRSPSLKFVDTFIILIRHLIHAVFLKGISHVKRLPLVSSDDI